VLVLPAILEKDREGILQKLDQIKGAAQWLQIDLSDGQLVPNLTLKEPVGLKKYLAPFNFEVHLMVKKPWEWWLSWKKAGAKRIIFHWESFHNIPKKQRAFGVNNLLNSILRAGLETGVALNLETNSAVLDPFISKIDLVQFMGISEVGFQGHKFQPEALEKAKAFKLAFPEVKVAIDGGVNEKNIKKIARAEVDQVAIGSGIFKSKNPAEKLQSLQELVS
jgi:ribulose-phosphate 3-epimerase